MQWRVFAYADVVLYIGVGSCVAQYASDVNEPFFDCRLVIVIRVVLFFR